MPPACKHPEEEKRLAALRAYGILDTEPDEYFNGIARLVAYICQCPIAMVTFVDRDRQWFKAKVGVDIQETSLDVAICAHAILQPGLFIVPDTRNDARFNDNPLVTGDPNLRFYAGALLETPEGQPLGTLCTLDYEPRDLTPEQSDALLILSKSVMAQLELRRHAALQHESLRSLREVEAQLRRTNEELARTRDEALRLSERKSSFLSWTSHELRTPLNAIIGYAELLIESDEPSPEAEQRLDDLRRIEGAARHLLALLNDLLDLAKIEAGRMELSVTSVSLPDLIRQSAANTAPLVARRGNQLLIDPADPGLVRADAARVHQILLNLIGNAAKFTEKGTISLRARCEAPEGDGNEGGCAAPAWIEITVADSGVGIDPGQLARLFEEYVQADAQTHRQSGGTGLGLTISRKFAELMGGTLTATSEPGRGSTFTLRLPAAGAGALAG